jgi:hypothetical protein
MFNEKGEIPLSSAIKFFAVFIPVVFMIIRRDIIFDTTMDERFAIADSVRYATAEKPLHNFNENIFKNIKFKGTIISFDSERAQNESGTEVSPNWLLVKLDNPVVTRKKIPLSIERVYDFNDYKKSIIYYKTDCMCSESVGDSIVKNFGEDFYRIKSTSKKEGCCDEFNYTTDFDYFWTIKGLNQVLDTIPKIPIWKKYKLFD